jgi:hypothetical protein
MSPELLWKIGLLASVVYREGVACREVIFLLAEDEILASL